MKGRKNDKKKAKKARFCTYHCFNMQYLSLFQYCNTVTSLSLNFYKREFYDDLHDVPFDFMTLRRLLTPLSLSDESIGCPVEKYPEEKCPNTDNYR